MRGECLLCNDVGNVSNVSVRGAVIFNRGNFVRSDRCCPNEFPNPIGQIPLERQTGWDSDPFKGAEEIDGGDFFIFDQENRLWSYFCHNGEFKSCFIIPDGFTDPTFNRYQAVGGIATFTDENGELFNRGVFHSSCHKKVPRCVDP